MHINCLPPGNSQFWDVFHLLTGLSEVTVIINSYTVSSNSSDPFSFHLTTQTGFPGSASSNDPTCQCKRHKRLEFHPWVGKIPWRRERQPAPAFLPGESHGQRSLVGYSPKVMKSQTGLKQLSMHAGNHPHTQTH